MIKELNNKPKHYTQRCETCGCVFTYEDEDIVRGYNASAAWWGDDGHYAYIKCPKCRTEIEL